MNKAKVINTSECEGCKYADLDESDKAKIIVTCKLRNKKYIYGQYIFCEDKDIGALNGSNKS